MGAVLSRFRISVVAALLMMGGFAVAVTARGPSAQAADKRVYVSVLDAQTGKPVTGLPADAFALREDNMDREIVKVEAAKEPMAVVLLVDTTTAFGRFVRDLRTTSQTFVKAFFAGNAGSSLAIVEFGGQDTPVVDFTTDAAKLDAAAGKLFPKGSGSGMSASDLAAAGSNRTSGADVTGSVLLEAFFNWSKSLGKRPETRRAIVSFNSDISVEMSKLPGQQIQEAVTKADVTLWAVSLQEIVANGPARDNVLNQLVPFSGGKRFTIQDVAALEGAVKNVADILASQYVVTYKRPSGTAKQVQVGMRRTGLWVGTQRWAPK